MLPQQYCLRWKHHHSNVQNMFAQLLEKERFCDVTLYCSPSFASQVDGCDLVHPGNIKGVSLRAHRVVLAACSELLGSLLGAHEAGGEPVLVIDGACPSHVRALLAYMYTGEMSVHHSQLPSLLKTAEELKIKGLTDIRWSNKDEPPDSQTGSVTATQTPNSNKSDHHAACKESKPEMKTYSRHREPLDNTEHSEVTSEEKYSVNGGPPPLIKLPIKEKNTDTLSPTVKRELLSDTDTQSPIPKRQRISSGGLENPEDFEEAIDQEWRHGNMDISAERVSKWGEEGSRGSWEGEGGEEEWGDAPADIGSFLHTRLTVDGDNSGDDSNEGAPLSTSSSVSTAAIDLPKSDCLKRHGASNKQTVGPKSGPTDPRFTDVIKLNDYLRHGRRPQFWEEDYVRRVMEAIRMKELEMKQAAEILGVSYGTLYGRYRDAFGCINRPFRALTPSTRDFWSTKGSAEVLSRLKRGEIPMDLAAQALGVSARDLYVHYSEIHAQEKAEFEPIPIEIDPSLKSPVKKAEEPAPARTPAPAAGRWRLNLENIRGSSSSTSPSPAEPGTSTSPTLLMRSRPDLTIVAARKQDATPTEAENGT